jgi:hypothetical protein
VWKDHKAWLRPTKRKCLQLYYYFLDRQLGLIHVIPLRARYSMRNTEGTARWLYGYARG